MTATAQELRDKQANLWEQMKEVMDNASGEGGVMTGEERTKYEALEKDLDEAEKVLNARERHEQREAKAKQVDRTGIVAPEVEDALGEAVDSAYREAFQTYVLEGMSSLSGEERKALRANFQGKQPKNAQGVGTGSAGGYLVPEDFRRQIIETMKAFGAVQEVAQVLNTTTGANLPWPTNDDTGNVGALLAENTQASEQDLELGTADLGAYKYTSKIVRVSLEFLQDVDWLDAEGFLRRKFAERLARIHNQHWTTGTGTNQPLGIVTGAVSGVTAASTTDITADELIDLQHSVNRAYRNPRSRFMLNDTALKKIRKLKASGTGEYLFQVSTSADMPNLLAGSGYVVNDDMADPAAGVKSVLYGDFEAGYIIRLVKAFELIRLDERYADYGQVGFIAFDRADGTVQDSSAYRALTQKAS